MFFLQSGSVHLFFPRLKVQFSQVNDITKFFDSMIFKYFEFIQYFDDLKKMYFFDDF